MLLRRGQVLTVRTSFDAGDSARVFVDLFRVPDHAGDPLRPLARVDSVAEGMTYEPYRDGEPWIGYRQFTRQFLFPLMLRSWLDVPFQPWLRGDMEGPTAAQMGKLLPLRKRLTPGALTNVMLQARMEARMSGQAVRDDLKRAGFGK